MSEVQVGVTVGLTTQKLANGRVVPAFTAQDIQVSIPSKHLHITLHGNWISKIANVFKNLFKKTIIHQIEGQLRTLIEQNLPKSLDELIAKQNGDSELYHDMALDWSLPYGPKVT